MKSHVADSEAMEALGGGIARSVRSPSVIYLHGELGAGKTTLVRGALRALGYAQAVKSPTYTLVESYTIRGIDYHHFDLYRLADAEELEFLGIRDYFSPQSVCFIEWPEKGQGSIPAADLHVQIDYAGTGRNVQISGVLELAVVETR